MTFGFLISSSNLKMLQDHSVLIIIIYFFSSLSVLASAQFFNISCLNDSSLYDSIEFNGTITLGMPIPLTGRAGQGFMGVLVQRKINGLDMYKRYINNCVGGLQVGEDLLSISTVFLDDRSNKTLNLIRARQLVENHGANFLFPSITPDLETAPLGWAEENKIITMTETGVSYGCPTYDHCFSVRVPEEEMMADIVKALALRGAKNYGLFFNKMDNRFKEMCQNIPQLIEDLPPNLQGVELIYYNDSFSDTEAGMQAVINGMKKLPEEMDVILGCTGACHSFINNTKNLGLDSKAMVFPKCIDRLSLIGKSGRYVLAPNQWDESLNFYCAVTGFTPKTFSDAYRWLYGGDGPFITGAGTFAGGLALGQAAVNAGSLDSAEVRFALSRLDIDTMYGRMTFNSHNMGSMDMAFMQTDENNDIQVVLPDSIATDSLIYPMPLWSYRACIKEHGEDSCFCTDEGCPTCTSDDYHYTVSSCLAEEEARLISFQRCDDTNCVGGMALPDEQHIMCDHVPYGSSTSNIVVALTVIAACNAFGLFVWVIIHWKEPVVKASQPIFCMLYILFGCTFTLSTFLFVGQATPAKCVLRLWMFHLSLTGMAGSLLVKVYRVWRVFNVKGFKKVKVPARRMLECLSVLLFIDAFLLLLLSTITPPLPETFNIQVPHLGPVSWTQCKETPTFSSALAVYKVAIVLIGCYFSFQIRHVHSDYAETKFIMFALYSIALVLGITELVASQVETPQLICLLHSIGISFSATIALICVFLPKILTGQLKLSAIQTKTDGARMTNPAHPTMEGNALIVSAAAQGNALIGNLNTTTANLQQENALLREQVESLRRLKAENNELKLKIESLTKKLQTSDLAMQSVETIDDARKIKIIN
mmetsp:Transcript_36181/g.47723  ORF Transcript_36181/g.47723 Transcript_36181/m.47723 type:complete len:875 (-) Transcript_36181:84-2708(-)